uniref:Major facilitator superfamily (MFS) profile domain-containing protein n=1 Tax=Romanomermis culicivorax TaxID=13658 RepID=A0A915KQN1_ROMCU
MPQKDGNGGVEKLILVDVVCPDGTIYFSASTTPGQLPSIVATFMTSDPMVKIFKNERNRSLAVTIVVVASVTLGTAFGIYNTSVVNNLKPAVVLGSSGPVGNFGENFSTTNSTASASNSTLLDDYGGLRSRGPSETTWSLLVAAFSIGSGLSTLVAPVVAERAGRKTGLLLSALLNIAGGVMCALYHLWFELAILGRFFIGAAFGVGVPLAAMFVTEIAPTKLRGACNAAIQAGAATGDALGMTLSLPQILGTNQYSNLALG